MFHDGSQQLRKPPLQEWTPPKARLPFDSENSPSCFKHAVISYEIIKIAHLKKSFTKNDRHDYPQGR
jgi:hypothetical protein